MSYRLELQGIETVTHDTRHLRFVRPKDFTFEPGQAVELSLCRDGWRDEGRPFTMVSHPEDAMLDFVIKIYPEHDGETEQIATLEPGEEVELTDPFGAVTDHGPGTFIAGGAGITPFIALLRTRARKQALDGCRLIFANKAEEDIILREEWEEMEGLETVFVTDAEGDGHPDGPVDRAFLEGRVDPSEGHFYICGPGGMVDAVRDDLKALGVPPDRIVTEEGW
ncbi:flavodoxin reductase [Rhodobacterales bacterium HKCCE2091]|nr:flavodoxin reductase [Rhodobacterales bacterium HKCCE2091]